MAAEDGCPVPVAERSTWKMAVEAPVHSLGAETVRPFVEGEPREYKDTLSYWDYIHPEQLTSLQNGREGRGLNHHDEHLFILVHQTFELWFKQVIFELEWVIKTLMNQGVTNEQLGLVVRRINRAEKAIRTSMQGFDMMETMDPADFLEFRDYLNPASGFQSTQMREIELLLGIVDTERVECNMADYRDAFVDKKSDKTVIFDRRKAEPTLLKGINRWLGELVIPQRGEFESRFLQLKTEQMNQQIKEFREYLAYLDQQVASHPQIGMFETLLKREKKQTQEKIVAAQSTLTSIRQFLEDDTLGNARVSALFLETFIHHESWTREADVVGAVIDLEAAFVLWRNRHSRMVERMIGRRVGTGGSAGVDYLDATTKYRVFKDLWNVRSFAIARSRYSDNLASKTPAATGAGAQ